MRAVIPTKDNPPPEMAEWLIRFSTWSNAERIMAINELVMRCEPTQVRHMMQVGPSFFLYEIMLGKILYQYTGRNFE